LGVLFLWMSKATHRRGQGKWRVVWKLDADIEGNLHSYAFDQGTPSDRQAVSARE
jgi:hypothetical protein